MARSSRSTTTAPSTSREVIERHPKNLYAANCSITGEPRTGFNSGFTPLVRCDRLANRSASAALYQGRLIEPSTLSYRIASSWRPRAVELGFDVCAPPPAAANSVAHAARLGIEAASSSPTTSKREAARLSDLQPDHPRHRRQLRRRQSAVRRSAIATAGLRQHQPALYCRGRRRWASRSSSSSAGATRNTSCHRSPAAPCCRASCAACATSRGRARRRRLPRIHAARRGLRAVVRHPRRARAPGGAARHHRQVDRHRQPGGRLQVIRA